MGALDDVLWIHARAAVLQPSVVVACTKNQMVEVSDCILILKEVEPQLPHSILLSERHAEGMLRRVLRISAIAAMKQQPAIALERIACLWVKILYRSGTFPAIAQLREILARMDVDASRLGIFGLRKEIVNIGDQADGGYREHGAVHQRAIRLAQRNRRVHGIVGRPITAGILLAPNVGITLGRGRLTIYITQEDKGAGGDGSYRIVGIDANCTDGCSGLDFDGLNIKHSIGTGRACAIKSIIYVKTRLRRSKRQCESLIVEYLSVAEHDLLCLQSQCQASDE